MNELNQWIIILLLLTVIIQSINILLYKKNKKLKRNKIIINGNYNPKKIMTEYEKYFFNILLELEDELNIRIHPQVNLATIICKESQNHYINELFRNIDFGIFTKDYEKLLLLIEVNDKSHNSQNRILRDQKVDMILQKANIKLLKFYSNYPNKKDYVKNRIKQAIISARIENNQQLIKEYYHN